MENNTEQTMSIDVVNLVPDLIKVQTSLKPVKKTEDNPYFKSKYAGLSSFLEEAQPILAKNNFAIVQQLGGTVDVVSLTTTLLHTTGAWIKSTITMTPVKKDPQATGSCITYARRYGLQTLLGMATEDDDGNNASDKTVDTTVKKTTVATGHTNPTTVCDSIVVTKPTTGASSPPTNPYAGTTFNTGTTKENKQTVSTNAIGTPKRVIPNQPNKAVFTAPKFNNNK